jgi:peptidoglycan/LPS O-acetylase OafA/YrhL
MALDRAIDGTGWVSSRECFCCHFIADLVFGRHSIFRPLLSVAPLTYVGKISYGVYLLHLLVFDIVDIMLPNDWLPRKILIKVVGSVLVASVSFHLLESPFLRLKKRFQTAGSGAASLNVQLPAASVQGGQP